MAAISNYNNNIQFYSVGGDRRIICMHDLGLDPQCDDWLAIEMLTSVFVRSI
jgi:hypothetical protein